VKSPSDNLSFSFKLLRNDGGGAVYGTGGAIDGAVYGAANLSPLFTER